MVEVSDTTLANDLGTRVSRYAAAGVPEVWIVDAGGRRVWTHRDPSGDQCLGIVDVTGDGRLAPAISPMLAFTADELFTGGA